MSTVVNVLCARVRMEEKWMIEALAEAGVPARQLPPSDSPLPVGPVPAEPLATQVVGGDAAEVSRVIIDRCADRIVAGAILPVLRSLGITVIDGGLAAAGTRLSVATALAVAGIPRPATLLVTSEDSGLEAVSQLGYPATLLPLDFGLTEMPFMDRDIAEAVLEHREVLGGSRSSVALIQSGVCHDAARVDLLVSGGKVVAMSGAGAGDISLDRAFEIAENTASVLGASLLGVKVVSSNQGLVVWDVNPVPDFRTLAAIGERSIATEIAANVAARLTEIAAGPSVLNGHALLAPFGFGNILGREVSDGVVLSA